MEFSDKSPMLWSILRQWRRALLFNLVKKTIFEKLAADMPMLYIGIVEG